MELSEEPVASKEEEEDNDSEPRSNGNIQEPQTEQSAASWDPRWVTVEPVIFLFMFSWGIHSPAINGLTYR